MLHCDVLVSCCTLLLQGKVHPCLLRMRASPDSLLREAANEALVLTGYNNPVRGRGIRILSLDGGGTRFEIVKKILLVWLSYFSIFRF